MMFFFGICQAQYLFNQRTNTPEDLGQSQLTYCDIKITPEKIHLFEISEIDDLTWNYEIDIISKKWNGGVVTYRCDGFIFKWDGEFMLVEDLVFKSRKMYYQRGIVYKPKGYVAVLKQ